MSDKNTSLPPPDPQPPRKLPPLDISEENLAYISALKPKERVIELGESCMKGITGTVYESKRGGGTCVMWDMDDGVKMGTSVTYGTRRLKDVFAALSDLSLASAKLEQMEKALKLAELPLQISLDEEEWKQSHLPEGAYCADDRPARRHALAAVRAALASSLNTEKKT